MALSASKAFTLEMLAPSGKPTTEHTATRVPRSAAEALATYQGFTHTAAKPFSRASEHRRSTISGVASGFSSV